ncbi:hypothetical protein D3C76_1756100 [compost metagenome]
MSPQANPNSLIHDDSASTIDAIYHSLEWFLDLKGQSDDAQPGEVLFLQGVLLALGTVRKV